MELQSRSPAAAGAAAGLNRLVMFQAAEVMTCGSSRGAEEMQTGRRANAMNVTLMKNAIRLKKKNARQNYGPYGFRVLLFDL